MVHTRSKMWHKSFMLILLFFMILSKVGFSEVLNIGLDEAIALGLRNSSTIKAKILAVEAAKASLQAARAARYPTVTTSASWTHLFDQPKTPDITFDSITIPGSYAAAKDPVSITATVNQSIYTFGKIKNSIEMAEKNLKLAEIDLEEAKRSLILQIKRAFYGYILAKEVERIQKETLAYKEEALEVAKSRYEAGLVPEYEVLQAESDLENFRPQVISAENQVRFALLAVLELLGIKETEGFDVILKGSLEAHYYSFDKKELMDMATRNRYELNQLRKSLELKEIQQRITEASRRPVVAGFVSYSLQSGYDSETGKNKYWGKDSWDGDLTLGVSVQMNISSLFPWSAENANVVKGKLEIEQLKQNISGIESSIRISIENALLKLEEERAKIDSGRKGVDLALSLYKSTRERYENGLASSMDLRQAQIGLNNAQMGYITSIYNYKMAVFDLMEAVGVYEFK